MNAMSVVLFSPAPHPERQALLSALEAGLGSVALVTTARQAMEAWNASPRSLLLLDLRGGGSDALEGARAVHQACPRARSLSLLPEALRGAPETDAVMRPPIYLEEVVRWCSRAALGPLAEEILADISAGLRHEIGNPLTSLFLQIELLKADPTLETVLDQISLIEESARRIETVVEDVASGAQRSLVRAEELSLGDLLEQTKTRLAQRSPKLMKRMDVTCEDAELHVDGVLLSQALADLWEYLLRAGEGAEPLSIEAGRTAGGSLRIRHRALTPRLPEDAAGRLFTPLWARQALGLPEGISLTTARNAFRRHGGDLRSRQDGERLLVEAFIPATHQSSLEFGA